MNLHANFMQLWSAKFPSCSDSIPRLDCLKADQFLTVNEQRAALEIAHSEVLSSTENLRAALTQQMFIADYLRSCITKLGAVSKVFSELEENGELDGNMSVCEATSATTSDRAPLKGEQQQQQQTQARTSRCSTPAGTPTTVSTTGTTVSTTTAALNLSTSAPPLPLLPSFLQTASPLLSAASRNFLFQSAISQPSMEQMQKAKTTADNTTAARTSPLTSTSSHDSGDVSGTPASKPPVSSALPNVTVEEAVRRLVDDMSAIPSSNYKNCMQEDELKSLNAARAAAAAAAMGAALGLHFNAPGVGETYHHHRTPAPPIISCSPGRPKGSTSANYNATNHSLLDIYPKLESSAAGCDAIAPRPYQCSTCGRSFAVKAGLMQHLRTHTDERPYPCPECGRAFKQKIQLTTHMRVHSGERPYGCRICGKLFRQQSHVVQHLRTHTGEKPHKCGRCNKAFRQKYSLISHQRRMCQSRASSNSMMAGMTMWIGPTGGTTVGGFGTERTTFESSLSAAAAHAREGPGESEETLQGVVEAKPEAAATNSHSEDHSSLSNRSCSSPASSHELALTSDGGGGGGGGSGDGRSKSADLCTLSYHQQEKQPLPDSNPHLHPPPPHSHQHHHSPRISAAGSPYVDVADRGRRSYMDSEYTSFGTFPNSDHMRLNGAFPGCLEDPVESTL